MSVEWELVGGPMDGDYVGLDWRADRFLIARVANPFQNIAQMASVPLDIDVLEGEYRPLSLADHRRRILRWQGWS
jgi:hypothetical protein